MSYSLTKEYQRGGGYISRMTGTGSTRYRLTFTEPFSAPPVVSVRFRQRFINKYIAYSIVEVDASGFVIELFSNKHVEDDVVFSWQAELDYNDLKKITGVTATIEESLRTHEYNTFLDVTSITPEMWVTCGGDKTEYEAAVISAQVLAKLPIDEFADEGLLAARPFKSFADCQEKGFFWFDVAGEAIQLYANGDGWVLIRSSDFTPKNQTIIKPPTKLSPASNFQFDRATTVKIASCATRVMIESMLDDKRIVSISDEPIRLIQAYKPLDTFVGRRPKTWKGDGFGTIGVNKDQTLEDRVMMTMDGLCWGNGYARWKKSEGPDGGLRLWVS